VELRGLGAERVKETRAGAAFAGSLAVGLRACLWSRVASRVLLHLGAFPAADADQLYSGSSAIPWEEHLSPTCTFAVSANVSASVVSHSGFAALRVKDAVVDRLRRVERRRPEVRTERPDVKVDLYLHGDQAVLSLDLSGEALSNRGYRRAGGPAPLRENLAAAVLLRAHWPAFASAGASLLDPMCGSGTLVIEGALMAADIAPGLIRDYFGFLGWRGLPRAVWEEVRSEAVERARAGVAHLPPVLGLDNDVLAVQAAERNVVAAGLRGKVSILTGDVAGLTVPETLRDRPGLIATNPPYGRRLGDRDSLRPLYATLGARLRTQFGGWEAAVLVEDEELGYGLGLRAHKVHHLYNGQVPCLLLHFHLGSPPRREVSHRVGAGGAQPEPEVAAAPREYAMLSSSTVDQNGQQSLLNRLRKNLRRLKPWAKREGVTCYRLYDRDLPDYNFAVDLYEDWVVVQEFEAPPEIDRLKARRRLREGLAAVQEVTGVPVDHVVYRLRRPQRRGGQYGAQGPQRGEVEVGEGGLRFLVNLAEYLDTGLFMDHRVVRGMVREWSRDVHFLNLFSYTAAASVYAADGGALSTTSVDLSRRYLDWARRNLLRNGFVDGRAHQLVHADCLEWPARARGRYGLILADVPTFSNSKAMRDTFDVQRDHAQLLEAAARLLEPGGRLLFSTNRRRFRLEGSRLQKLGLTVEDITERTLPPDFRRRPPTHRCWLLRPAGTSPALGRVL